MASNDKVASESTNGDQIHIEWSLNLPLPHVWGIENIGKIATKGLRLN